MVKIKRYICFMIVAVLTLSLFGCSVNSDKAAVDFVELGQSDADVVLEAEDSSVSCDSTPLDKLIRVSRTDMSALCFSEESMAVSVYEAGSQKLWRSIPEVYSGEKTGTVCVTLLINGNEYTLNSQSDSLAMGCASYEITEDSVLVKYSFRRSFSDGTKIDITVPVEYKGTDGTVSINIDCSALVNEGADEGVIIKSISVLPFMGAGTQGAEGDFILLPDSSGAVLDISASAQNEEIYTVSVYSEDPATGGDKDGASAVIPAFGMRSGNGGFVSVIDEGDGISDIVAHKAGATGGYNRVYAQFDITPTEKTDKGYYVSRESYKGNIGLSYRFVSGETADYVGMATVVRELLVRNGALVTSNIDSDSEYPFNLSIIGSDGSEEYTGFAQCYDIISALRGKGINSINLRYTGIFEGGTEQENPAEGEFIAELGDRADFDEFCTIVSADSINVYADVNIFSFSKTPDNRAVNIQGNTVETNVSDFTDYKAGFASVSVIADNVNAVLRGLFDSVFTGICINDAGNMLYSDFTEGKVGLRSATQNIVFDQVNAVSATKKLMVETGNLYAIKYAGIIVELPNSAYYADGDDCIAVPFVQAVLHGVCDYSLSPINLSEDSTAAFLKAIEYGAIPYYEWYHEDKGKGDSKDSYYYLNSVAQAQSNYERAKAAFADLRGARITDHKKIAEGVYLTVYDNKTEIYVNYGEEEVTVSGFTIEPKGFLRVN